MTVRDFINYLIDYDVDEEIEFYMNGKSICPINYGVDDSLPYIEFEFIEDN